jgi:hypothetical protein
MRLTLNHNTTNGGLMLDPDVVKKVTGGIDNPSDAIIPAWTSLYRVAHKWRYDRTTKTYVENDEAAAFTSPWWSTYYDFNAALWAPDPMNLAHTARATYAIHPGWRSDCSNYASITTETDLSVWYGLGKIVTGEDLKTGQTTAAHPSKDVLQIFIPGFADNHRKWSSHSRVMAFETKFRNGRGHQGNLPLGLRPNSV